MRTIELTERKKSKLISGMSFAAECGVDIIKEALEDFDCAEYGLNPETTTIGAAWQVLCDNAYDEEAADEVHCREEVFDTFLQALIDLEIIDGEARIKAFDAYFSLYDYPLKDESYDKYQEDLELFLESLITLE